MVAALVVVLVAGCAQAPMRPPPPASSRSEPAGSGLEPTQGVGAAASRAAAGPAAASAPTGAPVPAGRPSILAAEQRWLGSLFRGTPVRVLSDEGGALRIEVPLAHSFEVGGEQPKPPLQAVMQRVALSMQRQPTTRLSVAAPPGPKAEARQAAMREQLVMMGLPMHRVSVPGVPGDDVVSLRLAPAPPALARLSDRALPAPALMPAGHTVPASSAAALPAAATVRPPATAR